MTTRAKRDKKKANKRAKKEDQAEREQVEAVLKVMSEGLKQQMATEAEHAAAKVALAATKKARKKLKSD